MTNSNNGSLVRVFRGHLHGVYRVYELPDGKLVSTGDDRTLYLWERDSTSYRILHKSVSYKQGVHITKDGYIITLAYHRWHDVELHVWDDKQQLIRISNQKSYYGSHEIIFMLNSDLLLTSTENGVLQLWYPHGAVYRVMNGHTSAVSARELQNGQILSWGLGNYGGGRNPDRTIRLWSADGLPIREFDHHPTNAVLVIQLQNGNMVSSNFFWHGKVDDLTLKPIFIWDLDGQFFEIIPSHRYEVVGIRALKDGRFLTAGYDNMLHLRDETGQLLGIMKQHTYVMKLVELQKGRILVWAENYQLNIWQLPPVDAPIVDETQLIQSVVHLDDGGKWVYLHSVIELPDGKIVTCGSDNIINVWQLPDEIKAGCVIRPIKRLVGHVGEVNRLVLLRDGSFVSCGQDGTMCLWRL